MRINPNLINKYSTTEQVIGTWINGKNIYRKVIYIASLNQQQYYINFGVSIDDLISIKGYATNGTGRHPLNNTRPTEANLAFGAVFDSPTSLAILTGSDRSSWSAYVIVEYTKTTD